MTGIPGIPSAYSLAPQARIPLQSTPAQKSSAGEKKLENAAKQLEGLFLSMVFKEMQATVPKDSLFNDQTSQMFNEMLDDEFGRIAATNQGFGLAKVIVSQIKRAEASP